MMNRDRYEALSDTQKAQLDVTCRANVLDGLAEGEAIQGKALAELRDKGVTLHRWPPEILAALEEAWLEVVEEISASNPNFKKVWASLSAFRGEHSIWKDLGYL